MSSRTFVVAIGGRVYFGPELERAEELSSSGPDAPMRELPRCGVYLGEWAERLELERQRAEELERERAEELERQRAEEERRAALAAALEESRRAAELERQRAEELAEEERRRAAAARANRFPGFDADAAESLHREAAAKLKPMLTRPMLRLSLSDDELIARYLEATGREELPAAPEWAAPQWSYGTGPAKGSAKTRTSLVKRLASLEPELELAAA